MTFIHFSSSCFDFDTGPFEISALQALESDVEQLARTAQLASRYDARDGALHVVIVDGRLALRLSIARLDDAAPRALPLVAQLASPPQQLPAALIDAAARLVPLRFIVVLDAPLVVAARALDALCARAALSSSRERSNDVAVDDATSGWRVLDDDLERTNDAHVSHFVALVRRRLRRTSSSSSSDNGSLTSTSNAKHQVNLVYYLLNYF